MNFFIRKFSTTPARFANRHVKLLVCGGGTGGSSVSHKFAKKLGASNVAIIEPSDKHYYQPIWTLVGAGAKSFESSASDMSEVLPKDVLHIKDRVASIDPTQNTVKTENGEVVTYNYLVAAMGIQLKYDSIPGLVDALENCPHVGSNYSPKYVNKTYSAFQSFTGGNAIFTLPSTPIKCPGAPQKIMYLFDDYLRKHNKRDLANIKFNTSLGVIFGVKKYANELLKVCATKNVEINFRTNLVGVDHKTATAHFQHLDSGEKSSVAYNFLHVTPPMAPHDVVKQSAISDDAGWITINKETMQHTEFKNVFALGDNTNSPTSRTAAAAITQAEILYQNLSNVMDGKDAANQVYDGYTSCPLITSYDKCILAEFDFNLEPLETFPLDQGKERKSMYFMKANVMPMLYWKTATKGIWNGPKLLRKALHFGMGK